MHRTVSVIYVFVVIALLAAAVWAAPQTAAPARAQTVPPTPIPSLPPSTPPASDGNFVPISPPGFGDRHNSWAWSTAWWNGYLYVGTNRAWACMEAASVNRITPILGEYPPEDPDVACTPEPEDLPIQAEIWRWSPVDNVWQRVYQSPRDVPVANGKLVARDVGYRGMSVFTEPDGTEALYVGTVSPRFVWAETPPPRLLRSTDGLNFEPVPQDPGTVLGDTTYASLRNQIEFKGRFFILAGPVQGSGVLMEAKNPAGGNDEFQVVSPPGVNVSSVIAYNGYLYLGVRNITEGYGVIRTKATGPKPYTYETVVENGAYLPDLASIEVLGMQVFEDRLYIGTNGILLAPSLMGPAEIIRINPDNSWELVMGDGRLSPEGWKFPLSGFTAGFGNFYNAHMWRMAEFENRLFVGTFDAATIYRNAENPGRPIVQSLLGFDLYHSANGRDFTPITRTGFGDKFNFGVRSLEATPEGLFLGTANYYYGLQVWLLPRNSLHNPTYAFMPFTAHSGVALAGAGTAGVNGSSIAPPAPERVEAMVRGADVVVAWDGVLGAAQYQIWRAAPQTVTVEGETVPAGWGEAQLVAQTPDAVWIDMGAADANYLYYVTAVALSGVSSEPSNLAPLRRQSVYELTQQVGALHWSESGAREWEHLQSALEHGLASGDHGAARQALNHLRQLVRRPGQALLPTWQAEDAEYILHQLERRLSLIQSGILQP